MKPKASRKIACSRNTLKHLKEIQVAVAGSYESCELGDFIDITQIYFVIEIVTG